MTMDDDLLATLVALDTPSLDSEVADRTLRMAHLELPKAGNAAGVPLRLLVSGALVPVLLVSAGAVRSAETLETAATIFQSWR
jgi:hypothetical protein